MVGVGLALSTTAQAAGSPTTVTVTITNSRITFAPNSVPTGAVVFKVLNRTNVRRDFGIGAKRTGTIVARRSARLAVTLKGQGTRAFSSVGKAQARRIVGLLYLFEPCTDPTSSTVNVQLGKSVGGLALSPTSVPCGTVTFVVTDTDTPGDSFLVSISVPEVSGLTSPLQPGGTTSLTVRFPAKAVVHCDAVVDDNAGDSLVVGGGSLTLN
jgi:hypothetical protein